MRGGNPQGRAVGSGKADIATKQAIQAALERFERNIQEEGFKLSIADYVKLLQLKQELAEDDVREIKVRWVEPAKKSSGR